MKLGMKHPTALQMRPGAHGPSGNDSRDGAPLSEQVPPLEQVLPLLLHDDYLTAESRLACFGISQGMSQTLLRYAARTKLVINPGGAATPAGGRGRVSSSNKWGARKAIQQLAAQSSNVTLIMQGGVVSPAACLWKHITCIHLEGVELSSEDLSCRIPLQLHKLPHLHTLSFQACHVTGGPSQSDPARPTQPDPVSQSGPVTQPGTASQPDPANHPGTVSEPGPAAVSTIHTLKCIRCCASLLRMAVSLADPAQLQTLVRTNNSATDLLAQMPALQEVQLLGLGFVDDSGFQQVLQHPGLTRVSLAGLALREEYSDQPCSWASLTLTDGVSVGKPAALPLASISSCTVQGYFHDLNYDGKFDRAMSNANKCSQLVFQPTLEECRWTPAEPTFTIRSGNGIPLVMRHFSGGAVLVPASDTRGLLAPTVLAELAAAPSTLITMGFDFSEFFDDDWGEVEEVEAGVCTHLPAHIRHVVFQENFGVLSTEQWQGILRWFMKGVTRPLRLTLVHCAHDFIWSALIKEAFQEWLSLHTSNQVQVDFQVWQAQEDAGELTVS